MKISFSAIVPAVFSEWEENHVGNTAQKYVAMEVCKVYKRQNFSVQTAKDAAVSMFLKSNLFV